MSAIAVADVSKAYKHYASRWARLAEWVLPGSEPRHTTHWVLNGINLHIETGESVGIIGLNGAGKSTLLKLITGTTQPTLGSVTTNGRIAALLELGMGFHPEFSGRQNVVLAAQLMGFGFDQIESLMPEIEAFADIGDYIDQPVRVYSSGMQMRLAFSVATAVRPDILIIDEALSVGDVFFQQKCFSRIRTYLDQGTTLLFVSHALSSVHSLCDRAILIEQGEILLDGTPREVIDLYNGKLAAETSSERERVRVQQGNGETPGKIGSYEHDAVSIEDVTLRQDGAPIHAVVSGSSITVAVSLAVAERLVDPHIGFQLRDGRGEAVFMSNTHAMHLRVGETRPGDRIEAAFDFHADLAPGDYTITVGVGDNGVGGGQLGASLARIQDACAFSVIQDLNDIIWSGVCNLHPHCQIRRPDAEAAETAEGDRLLVTTSHALLEVDLATHAIKRRHTGYGTYYGIADNGHHFFVAARRRLVSSRVEQAAESGTILVLDRHFQIADQWIAPFPLRDMHEIKWRDGSLWVTCTHENMIAILRPDWTWDVWYPLGESQGPSRDINHINSITFDDEHVHLLAHNWGVSERLTFRLADHEPVEREPIGHQAHNLWFDKDQWLTCSSEEGKVVGAAGFVVETGAFPRGIARLDGGWVVGLSAIAEREVRDYADGELLVFDDHWQLTDRITLPGEGLVLDLLRPTHD